MEVMYKIKNELFGPEVEAVQYIAAESKKVKLGNVYMMFIYPEGVLPIPENAKGGTLRMEQLFTGTALLAVLAYVAMQLKGVPNWIWQYVRKQLVFSATVEESTELYRYFEQWIHHEHELTLKNVTVSTRYNREGNEELRTGHLEDMFVIHYAGKRLIIRKNREKLDGAKDIFSTHFNKYTIEGWKAKREVMGLLDEVMQFHANIKRLPHIYANVANGLWCEVGPIKGKDIGNVFIENKEEFLNDTTEFMKNEAWYLKRGIPYKRGYLFYGKPGNGKSSLAIALAKWLDKDLYSLNLNDIEKDSMLISAFSNIRHNSILLIEDVDAVYGARDEKKGTTSFATLLNCMDGVYSRHGIIVIMTTNHIERLDEAFIRAGRIDMRMHIDNPTCYVVERYIRNILWFTRICC